MLSNSSRPALFNGVYKNLLRLLVFELIGVHKTRPQNGVRILARLDARPKYLMSTTSNSELTESCELVVSYTGLSQLLELFWLF